jgi:NAD(P)-dependent dehydrogenase (short-subunit alcohol dehydrogenase family)
MIDGAGFGKVAIITGCASGLGLATTQLFLSHQYEVLGVDLNEMDYGKIDEKDQERFHFHRGDLTKEGECDEVVRICIGKYGYGISYTCSFFNLFSFRLRDSSGVSYNYTFSYLNPHMFSQL